MVYRGQNGINERLEGKLEDLFVTCATNAIPT
jgi:hypothetical protein